MRLRALPVVMLLWLEATSSAGQSSRWTTRLRRIAPRLGLLLYVGARVGPTQTVAGPLRIPLASANTDVGLVLRPAASSFAGGARTGLVLKPGGYVLGLGGSRNLSNRPELRGWEGVAGVIRRGDPAMGSAVDVPILPGIFVTFSRLGGIGGGFEWIPIPGAPFPNVRGAVTGYVSHPWIMPFSSPALDVVEWVGRRTVRPVKQRLQARWALARPGLARAGRAFLERLR